MASYEYDIAISFAGEDRPFAEELADALHSRGVHVFYDKHQKADLWGQSLTERLAQIYTEKAQFCLMLISRHYVEKAYTRLERQAAQSRALYDMGYILPVRLDDSDVPGMLDTVACLLVPPETPDSIAKAVALRTGGLTPLSFLDAEARQEIRAIIEDQGLGPKDRIFFVGLHLSAAVDRRREQLIADLTRLDQRLADRMALRDELMSAKEQTFTGLGDERMRVEYQNRIDALATEGERDRQEGAELRAQGDRLNEAQRWYQGEIKDMLNRSSATFAKLVAQ